MELNCFVLDGWEPRLQPASAKRDWMEATPERFAYRCLPLAIANAHGWEALNPCGFEARWNGGMGADSVEIRVDPGSEARRAPVSLFGAGTITFHLEGVFQTPAGWSLWVGGSPNSAKDGIAPLGGVIETDWSPYTFTMNWRFTRPDHWVRFEENEPFCFFFPVERGVLEGVEPRVLSFDEAPDLKQAFQSWSESRNEFQKWVETHKPTAPSEKWQKLYYRGIRPDGSRGAPDHVAKLRLTEFDCPLGHPGKPEPAGRGAAPTGLAHESGSPDEKYRLYRPPLGHGADEMIAVLAKGIAFDGRPLRAMGGSGGTVMRAPKADASTAPAAMPADLALRRRNWVLDVAERQRALSPRSGGIVEALTLSSEEFLDRHYAPGRPVVIRGVARDWAALSRWTPEYLADRVGSAEIEYQGGRTGSSDFELYKDNHRRLMPFDRFIAMIEDEMGGNDAYITAYNSGRNQQALEPLATDLGLLDAYLTDGPGMMWIGPAGTFTPLHFDLTNNLLVQLTGRKNLILLPPSETVRLANARHVFSDVHDITDPDRIAQYPDAANAIQFEVDLDPGDALYIPVGWWHQVAAESFSVMMTYTNFLWPNDAYESFPQDQPSR